MMKILKQAESYAFRVASVYDIHHDGKDMWTAHHQGDQVGYLWAPSDDGQNRYVSDIGVDPSHQRQGVGKLMWEAAGQPLHTSDTSTPAGKAFAKAVGGKSWDYAEYGKPHNTPDYW